MSNSMRYIVVFALAFGMYAAGNPIGARHLSYEMGHAVCLVVNACGK